MTALAALLALLCLGGVAHSAQKEISCPSTEWVISINPKIESPDDAAGVLSSDRLTHEVDLFRADPSISAPKGTILYTAAGLIDESPDSYYLAIPRSLETAEAKSPIAIQVIDQSSTAKSSSFNLNCIVDE